MDIPCACFILYSVFLLTCPWQSIYLWDKHQTGSLLSFTRKNLFRDLLILWELLDIRLVSSPNFCPLQRIGILSVMAIPGILQHIIGDLTKKLFTQHFSILNNHRRQWDTSAGNPDLQQDISNLVRPDSFQIFTVP